MAQFQLKPAFIDQEEFTVFKLKHKRGESLTETVSKTVFVANAEAYIKQGFGHYFVDGEKAAQQLKKSKKPSVIIRHKGSVKNANILKKKMADTYEDIQVVKR